VIPGFGFYVRAPRVWGRLALGISALLFLVVVGWFGYDGANLAFGLLAAIHASGLAYLFDPLFIEERFRARVAFALAMLLAVGGLIYMPLRNFVQKHWFFPVRVNDQVLVVRRGTSAGLQRGERIAYQFEGVGDHGLVVRGGFGVGPVLASPGDQLRFTPSTFEVNGNPQPRLSLMPESGELVIPQKRWFVWPEFAISGHGHTAESVLSASILSLGVISEQQVLGKPCRYWLWRRQL
jgi:hypothetical protein